MTPTTPIVLVHGHHPDRHGILNVIWTGTLEELLEANENLDAAGVTASLEAGPLSLGGGAAYASTAYRDDTWQALVRRTKALPS